MFPLFALESRPPTRRVALSLSYETPVLSSVHVLASNASHTIAVFLWLFFLSLFSPNVHCGHHNSVITQVYVSHIYVCVCMCMLKIMLTLIIITLIVFLLCLLVASLTTLELRTYHHTLVHSMNVFAFVESSIHLLFSLLAIVLFICLSCGIQSRNKRSSYHLLYYI